MLTKEDSQTLKGLAIILMLFHHLFLNKERFINEKLSNVVDEKS